MSIYILRNLCFCFFQIFFLFFFLFFLFFRKYSIKSQNQILTPFVFGSSLLITPPIHLPKSSTLSKINNFGSLLCFYFENAFLFRGPWRSARENKYIESTPYESHFLEIRVLNYLSSLSMR